MSKADTLNTVGTDFSEFQQQKKRDRMALYIMIPIFFIFPQINLILHSVPALDELQEATGIFTYEYLGQRPGNIYYLDDDKDHFYTCRDTMGGTHDCGAVRKEALDKVKGKVATIWWYSRYVYPFFFQRNVARIVADGQEIYSYEEAIRDRNISLYIVLCLMNIMILFLWWSTLFTERNILSTIQTEEKTKWHQTP
jgi:hypothetical protein